MTPQNPGCRHTHHSQPMWGSGGARGSEGLPSPSPRSRQPPISMATMQMGKLSIIIRERSGAVQTAAAVDYKPIMNSRTFRALVITPNCAFNCVIENLHPELSPGSFPLSRRGGCGRGQPRPRGPRAVPALSTRSRARTKDAGKCRRRVVPAGAPGGGQIQGNQSRKGGQKGTGGPRSPQGCRRVALSHRDVARGWG